MVDSKIPISLFLFFSFLITNKVQSVYIIELFYPFIIFNLPRHTLGFKVSHGESLDSCYQFDSKKVYDIIMGISLANKVNSIKLISILKPH